MELDTLMLQTGVILGLTNVIGRFVPQDMRDSILPVVAVLLGVGTVFGTEAGSPVLLAFKGIVMGGSVTGLYSVAKEVKASV